ncbi:MAG: HAD-IC family P-type ATPase [Candidatus Pacebacteria bacterium]|nr:HAD-IC family P-type ATPase [Candidatus Paceibacterota bacterium]
MNNIIKKHNGLTSVEAVRLLKEYGPNELPTKKPDGFLKILIRQFVSPFVSILVLAAVILIFLNDYTDALVIAMVLLVNAIIGLIQEGKAQNTLYALRKFTNTKTLVIRDGQEVRIDSKHVIPGDLLVLRSGNKIPADAELIESEDIKVNESSLTGESEPVYKNISSVEENGNKVFNGTYIVSGSGKAIVTETGGRTVIGSISKKLGNLDSEVPLKKNIRQLSRVIAFGTLIASLALFIFGLWAGYGSKDMFFTAVAIAVSVIPEGLPVAITLVLALGVYRMGQRNALVKRMQAVEALGQVDVVAVDKTGTITKNELMITEVYVDDRAHVVDGSGYINEGKVYVDDRPINPVDHLGLMKVSRIATLSSDASVYRKEEDSAWEVIGDPTEAAMVVLGAKVGIDKEALSSEIDLIHEIPFKSELQYHATLYKEGSKRYMYVAGSPEKIVDRSSHILTLDGQGEFDEKKKQEILDKLSEMSGRGLRVLAVAEKDTKKDTIDDGDVKGLSFVGLVGMQDSLREGVVESITVAKRNGIDIVMITGDYKGTAVAIAKQAGVFTDGDAVLTGEEIDRMTELELEKQIDKVTVFARVSPDQKLAIINAYKKNKKKIAMTGDGINDALSLVAADLGIGMGITGTEVAKEASDIVLLDDNVRSILSAVEEGRTIYSVIRKIILYLFSTNLSELFVIILALTLFLPLPLQPSQILWLNLITDGFLVLAFVFDPKTSIGDKNYTKKNGTFIISKAMFLRMAMLSLVMTLGTFFIFLYYQDNLVKGWTMAMTTMAFFQWFNIWNVRSVDKTVFSKDLISNPYLIVAAIVVILLQLLAVYNPIMNKILETTPLALSEILIVIAISFSIVIIEEIRKLITRII